MTTPGASDITASMLLLLLIGALRANVYLPDDRIPYHQITDPAVRSLAETSVAFVRRTNIRALPDGRYELVGRTLTQIFRMCPDAVFADEPLMVNCSGALVKDDLVLTAGHCITPLSFPSGNPFTDFVAVFGYRQPLPGVTTTILPAEDVHELAGLAFHAFSGGSEGLDLALVRLKRPSTRPIAAVRRTRELPVGTPLFILGYPLGVPLKYVDGSGITSYNHDDRAFRHELDTFSVNSGSPVFNTETGEIVGVHVRGTGGNTHTYGRSCSEWYVARPGQDWEEANYLVDLPLF